MKTAIIFGVTGQDGSYLSEFLLGRDYRVIGVARRASTDNTVNISHLLTDDRFTFVEGDITDFSSVSHIIFEHDPNEIYNLAAQSHVATSFKQPCLTWDVTGKGVLNILESIRIYHGHIYETEGISDDNTIRFYQASSSEMFGDQVTTTEWEDLKGRLSMFEENGSTQHSYRYQNEDTPFSPQSPYSIAKLAAHNLVGLYRKSYNMHASCGILFNHESERRGLKFVTRKITHYVGQELAPWLADNSRYELGRRDPILTGDPANAPKLALGNLDAERDWGHAEDYVRAMWLMLQQDKPDDYVIGTCKSYSVKDFLQKAFSVIGIHDYTPYVEQNPKFMRPADVPFLKGDYSKAKKTLGWTPLIDFDELVTRMVTEDMGVDYESIT